MKKIVLSLSIVGLVGVSSLMAGKAGDVVIDSDVDTAVNAAVGEDNEAEQNIHSVKVGNGGKVGDVVIMGKAKNVVNAAVGENNKAKQNVGSVEVQ